ncbi:hypothetical protein ACHAXS_003877 [Conticribra weissflogii]
MQAMLHPLVSAMLSSMESAMMELAMMKHPMQINIKKNGCEAFTTRLLRCRNVHRAQMSESVAEMVKKAKPTGRMEVR